MLNASAPVTRGLFVPNLEVGRKHSTFFSGEGFQLKVILNYTSVMPVLQTTGSCNFVFHSKKKKRFGFLHTQYRSDMSTRGWKHPVFSGVPTGLSVHTWLYSIHLCTILRIYSSSLLAKAPCVHVSFFPLSRSHLINLACEDFIWSH